MDRIPGWETKVLRRLFRMKKMEDETVQGYCMRAARTARFIWKKMKLPFLNEIIAECMWRAMGWVCAEKKHAVLMTLEYVTAWRSTTW